MAPSATEHKVQDKSNTSQHQNNNSPIPVIDFSNFEKPGDGIKTAQEIVAAFRDVGFVYLLNHGIPQETVDEAFEWSAKFFALPLATKMKAPHPPSGQHHRGYSSLGLEKVSHMVFDPTTLSSLRSVPDAKESYEMGRDDPAAPMPNIWLPENDLPGFRAFFNAFYERCYALELRILRALAMGISVLATDTAGGGSSHDENPPIAIDPTLLTALHSNADNQTRLLHYPPVARALLRSGAVERIAAHSDFGSVTLLFQDAVGGLEIEDPREGFAGVFVPAPCVPGVVVVNLGDFMQRWSNDLLRSSRHRVRAPPGGRGDEEEMTPARYSIPYFCGADVEKVVDCLPGCWGPGRPKRYEPISAGEYIDMRMNALY